MSSWCCSRYKCAGQKGCQNHLDATLQPALRADQMWKPLLQVPECGPEGGVGVCRAAGQLLPGAAKPPLESLPCLLIKVGAGFCPEQGHSAASPQSPADPTCKMVSKCLMV